MMSTSKLIKTSIEDADEVILGEVRTYEELGYSKRTISVVSTDGEHFELVLFARTPEQLELKPDPTHDWLTPKVYVGKSEHDQEDE